MDLRHQLEHLEAGGIPSGGSAHARIDAVLRGLARDELSILARVLGRWESAGHPDSAPGLDDLEPDDAGNVIDPETKALIATADYWRVYERVYAGLQEPEPRTPDRDTQSK